MGILGSMIYPNNEHMAEELNKKEDELREQNNLHNDLVNSYRVVGEATRTFDAYLVALTAMQYHWTYAQEDLSDLPSVSIPTIKKTMTDSVQEFALGVVSVAMAYDGIKALANGVTPLVKQAGAYMRTAPEGEAAASEAVGGVAEEISLQTPLLQSGTANMLATEDSELISDASSELSELSDSTLSFLRDSEAAGEELSAEASEASETASTASEAVATTEASAAEGAAAGATSAIAFAAVIIMAVTEVLSLIHAGQTQEKLKHAEKQLNDLLSQSETSLANLKDAYAKLLKVASSDIKVYNKLLPDLYAVSKEPALNRAPFSTRGISDFIDALATIKIHSNGTAGFQAAAMQNLTDAQSFISAHAGSSSVMTEIIKQIISHMRKMKLTDIPDGDQFLQVVAEANSIPLEAVKSYNEFRRDLASVSATMKKYHTQLIDKNPKGSGGVHPPKSAEFGEPDPNFVPKPHDFIIPVVALKKKAVAA